MKPRFILAMMILLIGSFNLIAQDNLPTSEPSQDTIRDDVPGHFDLPTGEVYIFDGSHKVCDPFDTLRFYQTNQTISQREFDLYSQLKRLFKTGKLKLYNPQADSLINAFKVELANEKNYSDSLDTALLIMSNSFNQYKDAALLKMNTIENDNQLLQQKINKAELTINEKNVSYVFVENERDKWKAKANKRKNLIWILSATLTASGTYIYLSLR